WRAKGVSDPNKRGEFLLKRALELGVAVGLEDRPIKRRFNSLPIRCTEPNLDRQSSFADVRMNFEREAFVEFHLQFRGVRFALSIARLLRIKEFELPAVRPDDRW